MPPSLPIKLVFLSPPALLAPRTGGAAVSARTMGPWLPAAGTGPCTAVGTPAAGTSTSPVPSRTGARGRARGARRGRVPSEHHRRSHWYRRSRGLTSRRDGAPGGGGVHTAVSCPAGWGARRGSPDPSPAAPGPARACFWSRSTGPAGLLHPPACFTCKLLPRDWLARQHRGIVPPAAPARAGRGVKLAVGTGSGCLLGFRGLRPTKAAPGREAGRRCSHCPGLRVGAGEREKEEEGYGRGG